LRLWIVFAKGVDRSSIGLPPIPLENAEWMGHRSLWQKQKRSSAANQRLIEEQPQIPFGFAQGRLSTHHPQTEERLGLRSLGMTASGDAIVSGRINNPEPMRAWTPARQPVWRPALPPGHSMIMRSRCECRPPQTGPFTQACEWVESVEAAPLRGSRERRSPGSGGVAVTPR
jgi:hypothetical protein